MTEPLFLVVATLVAILVVPPFIFALNEHRLRRRHRALAGRRKTRMRL